MLDWPFSTAIAPLFLFPPTRNIPCHDVGFPDFIRDKPASMHPVALSIVAL
jgi:hypothetical protein